MIDCPYIITDPEGNILGEYWDEVERDEALYSGDYPDDAEPAFLNEVE